jgi:hypothetical protein
MEKISANTGAKMSDVSLARDLIVEIAGHCWRGRGDMLDRVHVSLASHYPQWTRRRVRSLWHREAAGVRYHEMIELAETAQREKERHAELEGARKSHAEYIAETARLAALLERTDSDFHRDSIEAVRSFAGGMASAGNR